MAAQTQADRLTTASARGDLRELEMILHSGVNANERNSFNRTAIQVMKLGVPEIARVLLRMGGDPNVRDPLLGLTVAHDASRDGYLDTLSVLVQGGADVNLADHDGNLPLHLAAKEDHLSIVQFLVQHTSSPLHRNTKGQSPCDVARAHGRTSTADWLESFAQS